MGDSGMHSSALTIFGALAAVPFVATDGAAVVVEGLQSTAAIISAAHPERESAARADMS